MKAPHYGRVMAHVKRQPCFITGQPGVDAAHQRALVRRGPTGPRVTRTLDRAGTSHHGWRGLIALPVSPELHRQAADSQHALGYDQWLEAHGLTDAEVAWEIARTLATYITALEDK